jgi:hypothetical protein
MGIDSCIEFEEITNGMSMNDLAYDLACRVSQGLDHPCITTRDYHNRYVVNVWMRYYGTGYERGDWPTIRSILYYLHNKVRGLRYFGDSWDYEDAQEDILKLIEENDIHWANNPQTYRREWFNGEELPEGCIRPLDKYGKPMTRSGWGHMYASFYSPATGDRMEWRNGLWVNNDKK